jgi:hypothetical protein
VPTVNVKHVPSIDKCKCYLQDDRPVIVAPCFNPDDFTPSPIFDAMIADVKRKAAQS